MILELDGQGPRYLQIARALRSAVLDGALAPGTRLPATRRLAAELMCSRNIVVLAYEQLVIEGYAVARARGGTFVSKSIRAIAATATTNTGPTTPSLSSVGQRLVSLSDEAQSVTRHRPRTQIDFMYGLCEPDTRMVTQLKRGLAAAFRDPEIFLYGDPAGEAPLREEIARRLHTSRGVARTANDMVITTGAQQALDLCARLLIRPRDRVVVEDPGYEAARAAFAAAGAEIVPAPVDRRASTRRASRVEGEGPGSSM